ncbi:hypothetical protein SKAU_G00029830 [Synaphobranchus kaupii]|uniref:Uncharacterized protein n=1 Tax=Synaphobranchus kaupii TaxID=118154 RepID=A0A9Q1GDJ2_SYNKA|nr:hypothetical protein SKAU_G00029830 [Synaphobranchus kaupii]
MNEDSHSHHRVEATDRLNGQRRKRPRKVSENVGPQACSPCPFTGSGSWEAIAETLTNIARASRRIGPGVPLSPVTFPQCLKKAPSPCGTPVGPGGLVIPGCRDDSAVACKDSRWPVCVGSDSLSPDCWVLFSGCLRLSTTELQIPKVHL